MDFRVFHSSISTGRQENPGDGERPGHVGQPGLPRKLQSVPRHLWSLLRRALSLLWILVHFSCNGRPSPSKRDNFVRDMALIELVQGKEITNKVAARPRAERRISFRFRIAQQEDCIFYMYSSVIIIPLRVVIKIKAIFMF